MRQKRIQGSHFANLLQASQANNLVVERRTYPCMSEVFAWRNIPRAHTKMMKNQHRPGNMAVLVQASRPSPRTQLGTASCWESVCECVYLHTDAVEFNNNNNRQHNEYVALY